MTDAVLLTGKRGSGKTLLSVSYVVRALKQGRPIATNINFFPLHLLSGYPHHTLLITNQKSATAKDAKNAREEIGTADERR